MTTNGTEPCLHIDNIDGRDCEKPAHTFGLCEHHIREEISQQKIIVADLTERLLIHNRRLNSLEEAVHHPKKS